MIDHEEIMWWRAAGYCTMYDVHSMSGDGKDEDRCGGEAFIGLVFDGMTCH